jgi:HK97 family phage portal protein
MGIFNSLFRGKNKWNGAFLSQWGVGNSNYDINTINYLEKGYNINSFIYSIIFKQSTKTSSIPYYVKSIEDNTSKKKLDNLLQSTKQSLTPLQQLQYKELSKKAYSQDYMNLPLKRPNAIQSWREFHYLFKTFLKITGNVYIYEVSPEEGANAGVPQGVYLLPSQYMQIVIKQNAELLNPDESPVDFYRLYYGNQYIRFSADKVYHIKYSNPNYDEQGESLYGFSPLRACLRNIYSANSAVDSNIKTLLNNGAFGFIFGKNVDFRENQAKELKERMIEMDNSPERLSKLVALSSEIGFQRISLTTDELKPFDYLDFDQKQISACLNYPSVLLNNDEGAKYDNVKQFRKQVITDDIKPDLMLLEEGFWSLFLRKFKGYEDTCIVYDVSELPEMQEDTEKLIKWSKELLDRGVITRNELRQLVNFEEVEDSNMNEYTVNNDLLTLDEAVDSTFAVNGE